MGRATREAPVVLGDSARVHLGKSFWMTIDAADLGRSLSVPSWRWSESAREVSRVSANRTIIFTRWLLAPADGVWVDHRNGDKLDNRRSNLRLATAAENAGNSVKKRGSSRFKGVYAHGLMWCAQVKRPGHSNKHLGSWAIEEDAARAYDDAARAAFGEFACVNFPLPGERSAVAESQRIIALVPVVAPVPS